jgi:voltage-gated potassium channel
MAVNERALLALGLLVGAAGGKKTAEWVSRANDRVRAAQAREPLNVTLAAVLAGAAAFYAAERGKNPKVNSFHDALLYCATNISVGYSDIFAHTPAGKAIGSVLMTYGPALATRALDPPRAPAPASEDASREIVEKLEAILEELRSRRV